MRHATITNWPGHDIALTGPTLDDIRRQMNQMLDVAGPRGLLARTDNGGEIAVSLYDGQDYIKTPAQVAKRDADR